MKHANPCGVALAKTLTLAYQRAYATDPTSAFGGIIAFIVYALVPLAVIELNNLVLNFNEIATSFFGTSSDVLSFFGIERTDVNEINGVFNKNTSTLLGTASKLLGGVALIFAVFILSFYLTVSRDGVEKFLRSIIPQKYEDGVLDVYSKVRKRIGRWLQIQLFLSLMIGFAVFIGLWILGVKYSLVLAILAAVFELIPAVGPIFAGSLAILVALSDSFLLAFYVFLMFVLIQQLENYVVVPVVLKKTIGLHPVVIILSLMIGVKVAGFVGLVLAVPAAFLVEEIIENLASRRKKA